MQYNTTRSITENQDNRTLKDIAIRRIQLPCREKKIDKFRFCCIFRKTSNFLYYDFSVRFTS
ncbi:hypothetical protein ksw1_27030 [Staphylococcus aureus]|nr:hypothetical protein ksw1_27030 [Staphylococcus aureus]